MSAGAVYLLAYVATWAVGLVLMFGAEWLQRRHDRQRGRR